MAVGKSTQRSR